MKNQTAERRLFKAALAARRVGLAPQGPARCKGKEADFFAVFGCIGLPVPRKRDARRESFPCRSFWAWYLFAQAPGRGLFNLPVWAALAPGDESVSQTKERRLFKARLRVARLGRGVCSHPLRGVYLTPAWGRLKETIPHPLCGSPLYTRGSLQTERSQAETRIQKNIAFYRSTRRTLCGPLV